MELSPSPEALLELERVDATTKQAAEGASKASEVVATRRTELAKLRDFRNKFELGYSVRGGHNAVAEDWVDIRTDEATATTVQARRSYYHQPRDHSDIDMPLDDETHHSLEVRFVQTANPKIATEPVTIATISTYPLHTSLYIREELGMESGSIDLDHNAVEEVNPKVIEQALEIERDILNPILAARSV
jgi:hypothetical protein